MKNPRGFLWQDENTGKDFQLENLEATLQGAALNERVHAELCTVEFPDNRGILFQKR